MIVMDVARMEAPGVDDVLARAAALETEVATAAGGRTLRGRLAALGAEARALAKASGETTPRAAFHLLAAAEAPATGAGEEAVLDWLETLQVALLEMREEEPVADTRDIRSVVGWLIGEIGVTQEQFAAAVAVPYRTFQRWMTTGNVPVADEARLRLVARGLNEVRFALRGPLALRWLGQPHPTAGRRAPIDLVETPREFLRLASQVRFG